MPPLEDQPLEQLFAISRSRARNFSRWIDHLRASDPAFAEASALYPDDMDEWQAAAYLLTGSDQVWGSIGRDVLAEVSIAPAILELEQPRRAWSANQHSVMQWAAHFWDVDRWHAHFPYVFEAFYFRRWTSACHLYKRIAPALTITTGGAR